MVNPRMDPQWTIPLGESRRTDRRQAQDQPGAAGRVRARLPPEGGRPRSSRACSTPSSRRSPIPQRKGDPVVFGADECVRAGRLPGGDGQAQAVLPHRGRHGHRGQRLPAQRRCRRPPAGRRGGPEGDRPRTPGPRLRHRRHAVDPHYFGLAPVEAVNRALAKAGRTFADLSRPGTERGLRRPGAGLRGRMARVRPGDPQPPGRRHRPRPPARRLRCPPRRHRRPPTRPPGHAESASPPSASASARASPSSSNAENPREPPRNPHDSHPARHRPGDRGRAGRVREADRRRRARRAPAAPRLRALPLLRPAPPQAAAGRHRRQQGPGAGGAVLPRLRRAGHHRDRQRPDPPAQRRADR